MDQEEMFDGRGFFIRVLIKAFGVLAEASFVKTVIEFENDSNIPKGLFIDVSIRD